MSSIFLYELSNKIQFKSNNLFLEDNKMDLKKLNEEIIKLKAEYDDNNIFKKQGFIEITLLEKTLKATYIFENTLGKYTEISYDKRNSKIISADKEYNYFSFARIIINEYGGVIIAVDHSNEERAKALVISKLKEIGLEYNKIRYTAEMIKYIKLNYTWSKIKIDEIEEDKDSTKSISYEIDSASEGLSKVDRLYDGSGRHIHITFEYIYLEEPYTIKMYSNNSKITVNDNEFVNLDERQQFYIELYQEILKIKESSISNE